MLKMWVNYIVYFWVALAIWLVSALAYSQNETLQAVHPVATCVSRSKARKCEVSTSLKALFELADLHVGQNFQETVKKAQNDWLRPRGVERWQMQEKFAEKRDAFLAIFHELNFVDAIKAKLLYYDYAAVHGATLQGVKSRLEWLVREYKRGVRFKTIVVLSGERKLDDAHELPLIFKDFRYCERIPGNETEMIEWLLTRFDMPDEMRKIPVVMVNALSSGTRAHTGDTVTRWMDENPKKGSILAISSQPYVSYQDISMRNRLPEGFTLETIGDRAGELMNAVYLDNIARLLFELQKWTTQ